MSQSDAPNPMDSITDATSRLREASASPTKGQLVAGAALLLDLLLLAGWIVATDWLLFRIGTFLTWGLFFLMAVALLSSVSTLRRLQTRAEPPSSDAPTPAVDFKRRSSCVLLIGLLIVLLSAKLLWCGSWLQVACGSLTLLTFSMALAGNPPYLPELLGFGLSVVAGAAQRLGRFRLGTLNEATGAVKPILGLAIILPAIVVLAFSTLFVLANPNLATCLTGYLRTAWQATRELLVSFSPFEFVFWIVSGWLMLGLLYPTGCRLMKETRLHQSLIEKQVPATLYAGYRNSLLSLIVLFAVYLGFEFSTLWFRTFPENFYYAGYAHQGAFWLTAALALATVIMSFIFRDSTVDDPSMHSLKRLAMIWAAANLVLAAAVYNRLLIYIDFNGMTRMRVVGLLGITCVVVGFALVVLKTIRGHSFVWLIHRQLWVPMLAVTAFAVLPVDWFVNSYNARHVLAGDKAPGVQIIAHRTSAEGMLPLLDLVDVDDPPVREGVRALMALWGRELGVAVNPPAEPNYEAMEIYGNRLLLEHTTPWLGLGTDFSQTNNHGSPNWTNLQIAETLLARQLRLRADAWSNYAVDPTRRDAAISAFFQHAYQWY